MSEQLPVARALTFGAVAESYERYRLGYPDDLVDLVLAHASSPVRTALEIGAGTGKATRAFVARGIEVTASEPDAAMLAVLRREVPGVPTLQASFEQVPLDTTYDLLFAASSLHWTDPDGRWERAAALLRPGGVFASFGWPRELADPSLERAVREARLPDLPDDDLPAHFSARTPAPDGRTLRWPATELVATPLFEDVEQVAMERSVTVTREWYVGHLGTVSAYLHLDASTREVVLQRVHAVLPDEVELTGELTLHLARRA